MRLSQPAFVLAVLPGPNPSSELLRKLSSEEQVKKDTPPCFVWHTWEDQAVKVETALALVAGLTAVPSSGAKP